MAEQEPKPEMEQQLNLVVEYRHMVKNINTEHMKQQIKEELQIKILKQHEARYQRSKTSPTKKDLEETDARLRMREVQHDTKHSSWQVGQKSQEDQMVSGEKEKSQEYQMVSSESFTQSKKRCSKLVNQKEKIEKQFTKDDTNRKVLKFKKCFFTTSAALKPSKARQKMKYHELKHNEEELLKTEETSDVVGAHSRGGSSS